MESIEIRNIVISSKLFLHHILLAAYKVKFLEDIEAGHLMVGSVLNHYHPKKKALNTIGIDVVAISEEAMKDVLTGKYNTIINETSMSITKLFDAIHELDSLLEKLEKSMDKESAVL